MPRFSNRPFLATTLSFLSSRGADLPAASQEWNERVDIEPLPTHERSCFVSGHDFSRAAHSPQRWALAPVPISSTFCSLGAYPDFLPHRSHRCTYVVLPKENHMQLAEATSLDRKSGVPGFPTSPLSPVHLCGSP